MCSSGFITNYSFKQKMPTYPAFKFKIRYYSYTTSARIKYLFMTFVDQNSNSQVRDRLSNEHHNTKLIFYRPTVPHR